MAQIDEPTDRIEIHTFPTRTLTTTELLTGAKGGHPETITGVLYLPFWADRELPAVILLHGAGGIEGNTVRWACNLNQIGVAAFVVDSYTGRGIPLRQPTDYINGRGMIVDAYQGLAHLAEHPHLDATRIAGW